MNKVELINRVAEFENFETKKQAKEFVEDLIAIIKGEVVAGNDVSLAGFGKFTPFKRENGQVVPKFYAFEAFKAEVAEANK